MNLTTPPWLRPLAGLLLLSAGSATVAQQGPPGTDIWLLEIQFEGSQLSVNSARNVTDRAGYDNQPHFSSDGSAIWYTRIDGLVSDIWRYDLAAGSHQNFTNTDTSEYSPTPTPDQQAISVIRVIDGKQWLYRLPLGRQSSDDDQLLLPDVEPVGYHTWLSDDVLALFVLGEPHTLQRVKLGDAAQVVASNIGRGLKTQPQTGRATYVQVQEDGAEVRLLNAHDDGSSALIATRPDSQDFAWTASGWLLMGEGSQLWGLAPGGDDWQMLADLSRLGINNISRIDVNADSTRIAVVGDDPAQNPAQ